MLIHVVVVCLLPCGKPIPQDIKHIQKRAPMYMFAKKTLRVQRYNIFSKYANNYCYFVGICRKLSEIICRKASKIPTKMQKNSRALAYMRKKLYLCSEI